MIKRKTGFTALMNEKTTPQDKIILVVEDNPEIRQLLVRELRLESFTVYAAMHGQAAIKILNDVRPHLILSDINMPVMDGIEFYKQVRQNPQWVTIPFIFLTANSSPAEIQQGRALGVEDYLTKPIDPRDLIAIVNARLLRIAQIEAAHMQKALLQTVNVLANTIEGRDPYTRGHVERVAALARHFGLALGWSVEQMHVLEFGARLHDIGKVIVPDHVLKKQGALTEEEWFIMKQHTVAGAKILHNIEYLRPAVPYALAHHERWDGSGYPRGLKAEEIPLEGRMLALVDVYDALTSARPYHPPRPHAEVVQFMRRESEKHFDPILLPRFLDLIETLQQKSQLSSVKAQ